MTTDCGTCREAECPDHGQPHNMRTMGEEGCKMNRELSMAGAYGREVARSSVFKKKAQTWREVAEYLTSRFGCPRCADLYCYGYAGCDSTEPPGPEPRDGYHPADCWRVHFLAEVREPDEDDEGFA
jgi:hypothetical protein